MDKKVKKTMGWLQAACMTLGLAACDGDAERHSYYQQFLGQDVSAFSAQALDAETLATTPQTLADFLHRTQKPVLVNIWATWCPPCIKEMPDLAALAQAGEVAVLALSVDRDVAPVQKFMRKYETALTGIHFWWDAYGQAQQPYFGAKQYPISYLITKEGTTIHLYEGPRPWGNKAVQGRMLDILAGR